jgi:hypothetical protein
MSATPSSLLKSTTGQHTAPHFHVAGEVCPTCDQPIPHDRFDEVKARIETRQRERSAEITSRLQEQFAREKAQAVELAQRQASETLEQERLAAAEKIVAARGEGRHEAEVAAQERIAAVERANEEAISALRIKVEIAEAAKTSAEAAIEKVRQEAAAKEETIRAEAVTAAEAAMQTKLAEIEHAREESEAALQGRVQEAEAARVTAEQNGAAIQSRFEQFQRDSAAQIERIKQESAARESDIRAEARSAAEAAMQEKIESAEQARINADAKANAAEEQLRSAQATHEVQLAQRLQEQREVFERAQMDAVNAEKSAAFEEKMKLSAKVEELQRALDKKTAEELGEGAEIDLFETLKAEFEGDRIERVNKGQPGADILQTVMHNGRECGKIIYDSKNHNGWRNEFVTKLASDQMAARAEHAILSTRKFPQGNRQLHVQDGVILASPARVVAIAQIIRQHLVQTHTLRMSNEARTQKTAALYSFIISERCADLFARIDTHAEDLLELQVKEKKAHDQTWKRQGELIRSVQKVRAELCNEIDAIIGTAEVPESAS